MSASARRSNDDCSAASSRSATAWSSWYENPRPNTAPICAISRAGPSRSSRAASDCCKVGGIACAPPCSPRSNNRRVTSSTNNGTPPVRSLTPSTMSLGSARRAASSPTMLRDLRAIERRQRDHAMVRPHAPGRAELRSRRRDDQQRRLRTALGQRAHEIERSRVGPVQVLEGEHDGLRPRGRQNPCRHRRQLPAAQLLWGEFCCLVVWQEDIDQGREQRRIFGWVQADQPQVCSRSTRRCSVGRSAPKRWRPHSAIGCSGVFCNNCDDDHSTQVCGVSPRRP